MAVQHQRRCNGSFLVCVRVTPFIDYERSGTDELQSEPEQQHELRPRRVSPQVEFVGSLPSSQGGWCFRLLATLFPRRSDDASASSPVVV